MRTLFVGTLLFVLLAAPAPASADWQTAKALQLAQNVWDDDCVDRAVVQWTDPVDDRTKNAWGWTDPATCDYPDETPVIYLNRREHGTRPWYGPVCHTILHEAGHLARRSISHTANGIMRPYMPLVWTVRKDSRPKPVGFDRRCRLGLGDRQVSRQDEQSRGNVADHAVGTLTGSIRGGLHDQP